MKRWWCLQHAHGNWALYSSTPPSHTQLVVCVTFRIWAPHVVNIISWCTRWITTRLERTVLNEQFLQITLQLRELPYCLYQTTVEGKGRRPRAYPLHRIWRNAKITAPVKGLWHCSRWSFGKQKTPTGLFRNVTNERATGVPEECEFGANKSGVFGSLNVPQTWPPVLYAI